MVMEHPGILNETKLRDLMLFQFFEIVRVGFA